MAKCFFHQCHEEKYTILFHIKKFTNKILHKNLCTRLFMTLKIMKNQEILIKII